MLKTKTKVSGTTTATSSFTTTTKQIDKNKIIFCKQAFFSA